MGAMEDDEITHVAMKKIGYNPSTGNRDTVDVAKYTNAEKRPLNKRFKPIDAAAKVTYMKNSANTIAAALNAKGVSKNESQKNIERLGVPRDIAKLVKAGLAILQPQQQ